MRISIPSLAVLMLLAGCAAHAPKAPPLAYCINSSITQDGKTVGAPMIQAIPGKTASIIVDGTTPFSMLLTATPEGDNRVRLVADITTNGGHLAPTLVVREGKKASVSNDIITWAVTTSRCDG